MSDGAVPDLASRLLAWFDVHGRRNLPWQQQPTPYRVWVSEIMLQQTQVTTVIPYYCAFIERFPDIETLARAPIDEVLHHWSGLGYYARARHLHRAAQVVVDDHGGVFPQSLEAVMALPGIGRSTAGAVLALAGGERHPILDGNVKRVLARAFGVDGFPGEPQTLQRLWTLAERCTPRERVAEYTQAIMDLGATLCVRSRPLCAACPLAEHCVARLQGRQSVLPAPRPKKIRPQRTAYVVLMIREDGAVLLERRPPAGIWGGLWTLPQFEQRESAEAWTGRAAGIVSLPPYFHSFTHFDLTLHPLMVRATPVQAVADSGAYRWYEPRQPAKIGLTKPAVDLICSLDAQPAASLQRQNALL